MVRYNSRHATRKISFVSKAERKKFPYKKVFMCSTSSNVHTRTGAKFLGGRLSFFVVFRPRPKVGQGFVVPFQTDYSKIHKIAHRKILKCLDRYKAENETV